MKLVKDTEKDLKHSEKVSDMISRLYRRFIS